MLRIWRVRLDRGEWPGVGALPTAERERAERIVRPEARGRWAASRWALRTVLGHCLGEASAAIDLRYGERGKPRLADPEAPLRFNLSHSGELALIAVTEGREVGVDVQRIGSRPKDFYAEWTRREAVAKCHGVGLGAPLPDAPVAVAALRAGSGYGAAVAVGGGALPPLRQLDLEPG